MVITSFEGIGTLFIGIGGMVFLFVVSMWFMQFVNTAKSDSNKEIKYNLFEEIILERVAKKKQIDLQKEAIKREVIKLHKKDFRQKLTEEVINEMFGKNKEE